MTVVTIGVPHGNRDDIERHHIADSSPFPQGDTFVVLLDGVGDAGGSFPRRQIDFSQAIDRGARIVVAFGPGWGAHWATAFVQWLGQKLGFEMASAGSLEIRALIPELRRFFENERAHATVAPIGDEDSCEGLQILGEAVDIVGEAVGHASIRFSKGEGEVVFLPLHGIPENAEDIVLDFLDRLPARQEYPQYLDEIELADEANLVQELQDLEGRREEIAEVLAAARRTKQILYVADLDLEREVVRFLNDELGISVEHTSGSDEDFRLLDAETGEAYGIGEVKGYENKNLPRVELARVAIHRAEAGFEDDAPALLVANTFRAKSTLPERDEPIADNVISRAQDDRILIVRTLDLIRLKQLELAGGSKTNSLVKSLGSRGGWFEVTSDLKVKMHPPVKK